MSHSARMEERFRKRRTIRRCSAIVYALSCFIYLGWRLTIFNEHAMLLSTMYFVADVFAVLLGLIAIFVSWNYRHRTSPPPPPGLSVDVFVPVYKEPLEMVRRTLEAAVAIRYPHATWLLDDGRRPELRALAGSLGCRYLTRPDNTHAKAGNLNHALGVSEADFVAVFDADHIPQPQALDAMLGFFSDPAVAMVQAPQDYFNIDALQYANNERSGGLWHDQSFFYNISQPGRDHYEAASCAGTSVVYRRSALGEIGGIPTETITEDVHTSLKLHKRGYKVPFLNEPVAYGVAAADLVDYYRTRHRYGHGNIHALRFENALFCRGLTLGQRLSYLFLGLIYLEGWQQLLVFLVPSIALIFGIAPFDITIFNVLIVLLFPLWTYALMQEIGCGFSRYWTNEIFAMVRWPVHIVSSLALFRDRYTWRSSRKDVKGEVHWLLLAPQLAVVALSVTAITVGVWRLANDFSTGPLVAVVVDRVPSTESLIATYDGIVERGEALIGRLALQPDPHANIAASGTADPEASHPGAAPTGAAQSQGATPRAPPPAIPWFQPLTTGYTLDLVLVAGFWAMINALRGLFVVGKVVRNARATRDEYAFRSLIPLQLDGGDGMILGIAERLSGSEIRPSAPIRRLLSKKTGGTPATLFLPEGQIPITIESPAKRGDPFHPFFVSAEGRRRIEAALYAVSWHREFLHHDAEFATPLSVLARILTFARRSLSRIAWQAGGLAHIGGAPGRDAALTPVVVQGKKRWLPDTLIAFQPLAIGATFPVTLVSGRQTRSRTLRIEDSGQARTLYAPDGVAPRTYRYRVRESVPAVRPARLSRPVASEPRLLGHTRMAPIPAMATDAATEVADITRTARESHQHHVAPAFAAEPARPAIR